MKLHLGIIYKDGHVFNHRSLLKVVCNPLLRLFGWQIGSLFDGNKYTGITLCRCSRVWRNSWKYDITGLVVVKERLLW